MTKLIPGKLYKLIDGRYVWDADKLFNESERYFLCYGSVVMFVKRRSVQIKNPKRFKIYYTIMFEDKILQFMQYNMLSPDKILKELI